MDNDELNLKLIAMESGDDSAFEEIYKELKTPIYTIIFRILGDNVNAEDILHDVFINLYRSPEKYKARNPRAYLFQVARNLAIDALRKESRSLPFDSIENIDYVTTDSSIDEIDIEQALKTLPINQREIITLHINCGLKFREISKIMNIPLGTVLWRYQKALSTLGLKLSGGAL